MDPGHGHLIPIAQPGHLSRAAANEFIAFTPEDRPTRASGGGSLGRRCSRETSAPVAPPVVSPPTLDLYRGFLFGDKFDRGPRAAERACENGNHQPRRDANKSRSNKKEDEMKATANDGVLGDGVIAWGAEREETFS